MTTKYEAETYTSSSGVSVKTVHPGYTGVGFVDYGGAGTYIEMDDVDGGMGGVCSITANYALGRGTRYCSVTVNGVLVQGGQLVFTATGTWASWDDSNSIQIPCNPGATNRIRITAGPNTAGPNMNSITVTTDEKSCTDNASCEDGDSCTINTCGIDGKCTTAPSSSCSSNKSIVCGSTRGNCRQSSTNDPVKEATPNTLHEVRCCREGPSGSWNRRYDTCPSNIWGESILPNGVGCVHSATYEEAENYCSNAGGRLCTKDELLADCTRGSGCSHDHDYIWSSTPYSSSASTQQSTGNNKNKKKKDKDKLPWL